MAEAKITFETLPTALDALTKKVDHLVSLVEKFTNLSAEEKVDNWMNIDDLCAYHPDRPAKKTVYEWVTLRKIPYHKDGKRLRFLKSEIDAWLAGGYHKTDEEIYEVGVSYVNGKREGRL